MESCRELKENNPYLFNSWRSILYTEKGRKAGVVDEWRKFPTFYKDVHETYKEGLRLCRKDKNKPFGPNNFEWVTNLELAQTNTQTIKLTYNGETKTLREWSEEYGMSYNGLLLRYVRNKNYTIEEILFGKKRKPKSKSTDCFTKHRKIMRYVIVTEDWCLSHGIVVPKEARRSLDGTKVVLHEEFINPIIRNSEEIDSYLWDSSELMNILDSSEWVNKEDYYDI